MNDNLPGAWRLQDHPLHIAAAGLAVIILAAVLYWVPGIVLVGSVSQVRDLCNSGIGLLAAAPGCTRAENWTGGLAVAAVTGAAMAATGAFLASRSRAPG